MRVARRFGGLEDNEIATSVALDPDDTGVVLAHVIRRECAQTGLRRRHPCTGGARGRRLSPPATHSPARASSCAARTSSAMPSSNPTAVEKPFALSLAYETS